MKIALLIPSRERLQQKKELVDSLIATTSDLKNITLYFGIDSTDPTKQEVINTYKHEFIKIVEIPSDGTFKNLGVLWNICAREAKEEILAMIGDDMVFMTKDWDKKILSEFEEGNCPKDNLKMVYCYDGRHGPKIAVNAFVHRVYMDTLGYFMREEFKVDFIDLWLHQIFKSLGRIRYRGDVHIEHKHWSFRKMPKDNVANNLRGNNYPEISQKLWVDLLPERIKESEKLGEIFGIKPDLSAINGRIMG